MLARALRAGAFAAATSRAAGTIATTSRRRASIGWIWSSRDSEREGTPGGHAVRHAALAQARKLAAPAWLEARLALPRSK
jgi:hypothetical protein